MGESTRIVFRALLEGTDPDSPTARLRLAVYEGLGSLGWPGLTRIEAVKFAAEGIAAALAGGPEAVLTVAVHDGRYVAVNGGPLMLDITSCETVRELPAAPAISLVVNVTEVAGRAEAALQRSQKNADADAELA